MSEPSYIVTFHRPLKGARLLAAPPQSLRSPVADPVASQESQPAAAEDIKYVRAAISQLVELIHDMDARNRQSVKTLEQIAIDLAITVAGQILFREIHADQFPFAEIVTEFLARFDVENPARVLVHPLDLRKLQSDWAEVDDVKPFTLEFAGDSELPRGSVRVASDTTELFFSVATQLSEIRQELMEKLYDAKIERRETKDADSTLRRFPDRRASG